MASNTDVPTMSTSGYVKDVDTKFDFLMSDFFLSDYNQTFMYPGYVTSLPHILQNNGNDIAGAINSIKNKLTEYLNRYFVYAEVKVVDATEVENSSTTKLNITVKINDNGTNYSYIRMLQYSGSKIENITKINNFGA